MRLGRAVHVLISWHAWYGKHNLSNRRINYSFVCLFSWPYLTLTRLTTDVPLCVQQKRPCSFKSYRKELHCLKQKCIPYPRFVHIICPSICFSCICACFVFVKWLSLLKLTDMTPIFLMIFVYFCFYFSGKLLPKFNHCLPCPAIVTIAFLVAYFLVFCITFLADRSNGRAIATLLRLSSVCNVMYCG